MPFAFKTEAAIKRVSLFVHNLADNPIVRAAPLARALQKHYEVEILGFAFGDADVYYPYRGLFDYKIISCRLDVGAVLKSIPQLASLATGQLLYAFKPLLTSFGPALYAARMCGTRPLLLDVEDDEWIPMGKTTGAFVWRDLVRGWKHATAWKYTRLIHPLTAVASGVTVASRRIQLRYGGVIVRHGPDESLFDPNTPLLQNVTACRRALGLPDHRKLVLFAGIPRPHKGLSILIEAFNRPQCSEWDLVLAGPPDEADFLAATAHLRSRCFPLGLLPQARMPNLLAAVDAVAVPQRPVRFAESQVPAKAIEAMAMLRPVVGSRVGDMPEILGNGSRGWLFEPDDPEGVALSLEEIAADPLAVSKKTREARNWFELEASTSAICRRLTSIVGRLSTPSCP